MRWGLWFWGENNSCFPSEKKAPGSFLKIFPRCGVQGKTWSCEQNWSNPWSQTRSTCNDHILPFYLLLRPIRLVKAALRVAVLGAKKRLEEVSAPFSYISKSLTRPWTKFHPHGDRHTFWYRDLPMGQNSYLNFRLTFRPWIQRHWLREPKVSLHHGSAWNIVYHNTNLQVLENTFLFQVKNMTDESQFESLYVYNATILEVVKSSRLY